MLTDQDTRGYRVTEKIQGVKEKTSVREREYDATLSSLYNKIKKIWHEPSRQLIIVWLNGLCMSIINMINEV